MLQPVQTRPTRQLTYLLLALIVLAGLALRTWHVNFDRGIGSHPDERSTSCFYAPTIGLPSSWAQFWDPQQSPLNPLRSLDGNDFRHFTYGHFPLYLGVAFGNLLHRLAPLAETLGLPTAWTELMARADQACDALAVAGRLVIGGLDTLTIVLLYLLTRRIYGRGAGLLAAAFYAFTAQAIQLSHFFAMDPASTTFTVLTVLGAVQMWQERTLRAALLTGVGAGLAIASKFSALPILGVPVVAGLLVLWSDRQHSQRDGQPVDGRAQFSAIIGMPLALLVAVAIFCITSPYAVLDRQHFLQATLVEQGAMVRGVADMPFTRQYRNTTPYFYFLEQQLRWGLGWPLGAVAAVGSVYAFILLVSSGLRLLYTWVAQSLGWQRRLWLSDEALALLIVWSWVLPYFAITGAFLAKFNRYMSPLLPFVLLFAAGLIVRLWRGRHGDKEIRRHEDTETMAVSNVPVSPPLPVPSSWLGRSVALLLAVIGLTGGLFWSLAFVNGVYNHEHTWITASRWIYQNVPRDSVLLWELWDDALPKAIPNEPGMDMGSTGLRNIDWSPYEEDTAEKYAIMKERLREADYVVYSSKRIYDSVDELPERYPMTTRYYDAMWSGALGFERAQEVTSPPQLLGFTFDDRTGDESWSLYDHPQVTIFKKVRDLSDAEYDALFAGTWEQAIPWYRGKDSPISPLLNLLGLGNSQESEKRGLLNAVLALVMGSNRDQPEPLPEERHNLLIETPLAQLPVVDNYRWNQAASTNSWLGVVWWWLVLSLLGWAAWPLAFYLFRPLPDRGYWLSRALGWLLAGWLLWLVASFQWAINSVRNAWLSLVVLAILGGVAAIRQGPELRAYLRTHWRLLLVGEALFAVAYVAFILIRMGNPDLWQPWFGGEKFMEFAFLNGILRSPYFPPVDPHFAGGYINYYYFGIYLVTYLIKLTGIHAEVAFNLAIPTLFALTVLNSFAVAYAARRMVRPENIRPLGVVSPAEGVDSAEEAITGEVVGENRSLVTASSESTTNILNEIVPRHPPPAPRNTWATGLAAALLAPLFVAIIGNLDGFAQLVRNLAQVSGSSVQSAFGPVQTVASAVVGLRLVMGEQQALPGYDFWGPSRVIPATINEFPYWSFLFADLHPHVIGMPLAVLFLGLAFVLLAESGVEWRQAWRRGLILLVMFGLLLGTLASVNLWELPTYWGLGLLALIVAQARSQGRVNWALTAALAGVYLILAYLCYLPFFRNYVGIGASGIGLVKEGDALGTWLLIWGFFAFLLVSWVFYALTRAARPEESQGLAKAEVLAVKPPGIERVLTLAARQFDRLPRLIYWHQRLVTHPTVGYLLALGLLPLTLVAALLAWSLERTVVALCLLPLGVAVLLLWRRSRAADAGALFVTMLTATGLAILVGTQIVFLKDFLAGGDWYRMNTLFKFFSQVWVMWGIAAAIAVPRIWQDYVVTKRLFSGLRAAWALSFILLLVASLAYLLYGTPARLDMRMVGWRPPVGTLNALDYMRAGSFTWPDEQHRFDLKYDWEAIRWLLQHVRGNVVVAESDMVSYYREGGSRVASMTGLSGIFGFHEREQRYNEEIGVREGLHREFWETPDIARTQQIIDELHIGLVYVGQLEQQQHPAGVQKMAQMAANGQLTQLYQNERVIIYQVPERLVQVEDEVYVPNAN